MTATHEQGPHISFGYAPGSAGANPEFGPGATFMGDCILDPRYPYNPGVAGLAQARGLLSYPYNCLVDAAPKALSAALIVAAATATSGTPMTLQSTNASGRAVNVPLLPFGASQQPSSVVTPPVMVEPGHTVGSATSGSRTLASVGDGRMLRPGQWIAVVGAGIGSGLLVTRIASRTQTSIVMADAAGTTVAATPIIVFDTQGLGFSSHLVAGAVAVFDPYSGLARNATVTSNNAGDTGWTMTLRGYDIYGVPLREDIAVTANATVQGKKAFKFFTSATPTKGGGGSTTGTLSVGVGDIYGLALRAEAWEYLNIFYNGAFVSSSTGVVAADANTPTATTGDVRGTYAVQSAADGVKRLAIFMSLPARQLLAATPEDPTPMFGLPQFFS